MTKCIFSLSLLIFIMPMSAQQPNYENYPVYDGNDLGLVYTSRQSTFRIWAPTAEQAQLIFYANGSGGAAIQVLEMKKSEGGTWLLTLAGDHKNKFYVFRVKIAGQWQNEVPDPYAKAVGVNGKRAIVTELTESNPAGWENDLSPAFNNKTDAIIYELHVRDASIHKFSGIQQKGKYIGLTETGAKNKDGLSTGLDHIKEMGVTHVHLLPTYDFYSLDESKQDSAQYNWGYDPQNYNVPDGFYSTNPFDGNTRIREFKELVKTFHQNGLRVVLDVVYNHTRLTEESNFNQLVPGYYYRQTADGKFSNATACGNETASERFMMRKFMLESMLYWVKEYHVDGFRVDLMGVHDIETMNLISKELHAIRPDILIYGEGWTAGASPLPEEKRAVKQNAAKLDRIAVFSDDIRDGLKGSVFVHDEKGFVSGKPGMEESIKFGIVAATRHPQVNYGKVNYSKAPYSAEPHQTIAYAECHDNHVLWDKLSISATTATDEERKQMHKLALSIVLTSQGIPFLHAGGEFLRTKKGVENSFESPDSINAIDWSLKATNNDVVEYVRALINMRKEHPAFRMKSADEIRKHLVFDEQTEPGLIAYAINGKAAGDKWSSIYVIYNGTNGSKTISLPKGTWNVFSAGESKSLNQLSGTAISLPYSCNIYYQE